jgi:hypothetical protein
MVFVNPIGNRLSKLVDLDPANDSVRSIPSNAACIGVFVTGKAIGLDDLKSQWNRS